MGSEFHRCHHLHCLIIISDYKAIRNVGSFTAGKHRPTGEREMKHTQTFLLASVIVILGRSKPEKKLKERRKTFVCLKGGKARSVLVVLVFELD